MLSNSDQNLPEDVVNEILSRLPVKSLLRFKYVYRYWYTLIKSPDFISKHFNQENNNGRLLVQHYISDIDRYAIALFPDETLADIPPLHENLGHLQSLKDIGNVVGPIDDIFLLHIPGYYSNSDRMALWNPAMREFNRLHVLEPIFPLNFHALTSVVGFGLDPLTRDYKIIWIRYFVERIGDETYDIDYPYHVAVIYTLSKESWRHFDLLTIPKDRNIYNSLCATCINKAYYWLSGLDYSEHRILSFHMWLKEFREKEGPDHPEPQWGFLSLYNDSIGLFLCQTGVILQSIIDIWVMEEEGCWTKLIIVNPFPEVFLPREFWKEELLFES
ncbi:unnamed protein product [Camellia sinensis]